MKTEEDEAFEDIERRQGGGFKAKQAMAADKQEPWDWAAHEYDGVHRKAQPAQEPVAWMVYTLDGKSVCVTDNPTDFTDEHRALPLYTTPSKRPWVGLTDEEIAECFKVTPDQYLTWHIYKRIEAKLKEKNT